MAYKDAKKRKEYQRQYYLNKTILKRRTNPPKNYYKKKSEEEIAVNRREGGIKAQETLKNKMGEDAYREMMSSRGKHGLASLRASGKPIGFQAGYAKEAQLLGAKARSEAKQKRKRKNGTE